MQSEISAYDSLRVVEGSAFDLIFDDPDAPSPKVMGILTEDGRKILSPNVVITTGTFLRGKCYLGKEVYR
eukprot:358335-Amorphochlora_amoeboformis.AAC.1